jgi:hypothetical protein
MPNNSDIVELTACAINVPGMTLSMLSFYIVFYACNFPQNNQVKFNGQSDESSSQKILGYVSYNTSGKTASPHISSNKVPVYFSGCQLTIC